MINLERVPVGERLKKEEVYITPKQAKVIIEYYGNNDNRNIILRKTQGYTRDMLDGSWLLNGQTISFDKKGKLVDGHNRLTAVVDAGKVNWEIKIPFTVVYGISEKAVKTIDMGRSRKLSDIIRMEKIQNPETMSAALKHIWSDDNSLIHSANSPTSSPTSEELLDTLDRHPGIIESYSRGVKLGSLIRSKGTGVFIHYKLSQIDKRMTDWFCDSFGKYGRLPEDHPITSLWEAIEKNYNSKDNYKSRSHVKFALFFKTWNYIITGKKAKNIKWRYQEGITPKQKEYGVKPEKFPVPLDPAVNGFNFDEHVNDIKNIMMEEYEIS